MRTLSHPNLDALMRSTASSWPGGYAGDTQRYYTSAQSYLTFSLELNTDSDAASGLTGRTWPW